jgi:hypothetical protein
MTRIAILIAALALTSAAGAQETGCTLRLQVWLTPDVENPKDPAFLSSLVGDPAYRLVLLRTLEGSEILQLSGPPNTCHSKLTMMRMNAYVLDIHAIEAKAHNVK